MTWTFRSLATRVANAFFSPQVPAHTHALGKSTHELVCEELLDRDFYLSNYPDLADAGVDPLLHYTECGHAEGRFPLNLQKADAAARIKMALKHNPDDRRALALYVFLELSSHDASKIIASAKIDLNLYLDQPPQPHFQGVFELAAMVLLGHWMRFESTQTVAEIRQIILDFKERFPESPTLRAVHAQLHFESGHLTAARQEFGSGSDIEKLPPDLQTICRLAIEQLQEAETINKDQQNGATGLLLLDSAFPSKISSFRYGEFSTYLKEIDDSVAYVRPDANLFRYGEKSGLTAQIQEISQEQGISANRVQRFSADALPAAKVAYCVFMNLADLYFNQIDIPSAEHFVFTLYPGGGFAPQNPRSDEVLRRICSNPKVTKIITTQITSYRYLIDNDFCSPDRILHIFGGIIPGLYSDTEYTPRTRTNSPLNICFVAQRYSPIGAEKGYDVFAEVIKRFSGNPDIHFHVVGGFDESVIDIGNPGNVTFHGTKPASFFPGFYSNMDIILSPNIQMSELNPAYPATFDGFPTTCVVEAGLQGVAMLLTDFQNMNQNLDKSPIFTAEEAQIIDRDVDNICGILQRHLSDRDGLQRLGEAGRKAVLREFSFDKQMAPRIALLKELLSR